MRAYGSLAAAVCAAALSLACQDASGDLDAPELCGNGRLDPFEVCDGEDLGAQSCARYGYPEGRVRCAETCNGVYVDGCRGLPSWGPPPDPCAACGPGTVCRGLSCVPSCEAPALGADGPIRLDARPRTVQVVVAPPDNAPYAPGDAVEVVAWHPPTGATVRARLSAAGAATLLVPPGAARLYVVPPAPNVAVWTGPTLPVAGDAQVRLEPVWRPVRLQVTERLVEDISVRSVDAAARWPREVREAGDVRASLEPIAPGRPPFGATVWLAPGRYAVAFVGSRAAGFALGGVPPLATALEVLATDAPITVPLDPRVRELRLVADLPAGLLAQGQVEMTRVWLDDPTLAEIPVALDGRGRHSARVPAGTYAFRFRGLQSPPVTVGAAEAEVLPWTPELVPLEVEVRDPSAVALRIEQSEPAPGAPAWQQAWPVAGGRARGIAPAGGLRVALQRRVDGRTLWQSLGTWAVGPDAQGTPPPAVVPDRGLVALTVDLRLGAQPIGSIGSVEREEVQLALQPYDRPELLAATVRGPADQPLAVVAPPGRYRLVLLDAGPSGPSGAYVLDPDLVLERDRSRLYDARLVPVRLQSGLTPGPDERVDWFVAPFAGRTPDGAPRPAVAGARLVAEGAEGEARVAVYPGRYRALLRAPGTDARAQLLDADRAFAADAPADVALGRRSRAVSIAVDGPASAVRLTGSTWTAEGPLVDGRLELGLPGYDYAVDVVRPDGDGGEDGAPWRVRAACAEP